MSTVGEALIYYGFLVAAFGLALLLLLSELLR